MPSFQYLPFTFDELPIKKQFQIGGIIYGIEVRYNFSFDKFALYISDENDNLIFTGRLSYGRDVFADVNVEGIPDVKIIPINLDDAVSNLDLGIDLTSKTFGDTVKLYIV